jgi:hypothetical protein
LEYVALWLICGLVSAIVASSRGANGCGAFLVGMLLGPFGIIIAFVMPAKARVAVKAARDGLPPAWLRECPACKSQIQVNATVCKFCQRESPAEDLEIDPPCAPGRKHKWEDSTLYPGFIVCRRCETYGQRDAQGHVIA